jgi:immune inhibitor A
MSTFAHVREAAAGGSREFKRPVVALLVFALLVAMAAVSQSPPASAGDPASGGARVGPSKAYYNPVAPRLDRIGDQQERLGTLDRGAGVGVISHEYGHDLGLPDLYDTSGAGESDVDFWDLMSSGSHTGPLFQTIPTHMGLWDKYVLGWVDPETFGVGSPGRNVKVRQTSRTPRGTEDGIRVNLPSKTVPRGTPHSGENMWYSNNDQPWADVKISRTLEVPAGADVRFWVWNNYTIEELWDYGFIEVSTDGGATWTQLEVRDEAGNVVSTNEDPNGRLRDYGGLQNGLTGTTGGEWRHDWVNLTPYAGTTIGLRLRYATDAAFEEPGWFADDFEVTADGASVWTDDVESDEWRVTRTPYNAPGMLVWYRDAQYTVNHVTIPIFAPPSTGSKGQLVIVDSHFDPLRRFGEAAAHDPTTLKNLPSRAQSSNAAFAKRPTRQFRECSEDPVGSYTIYATATPRCPASPASPTPGAGTRGWSCAARTCSSATSTPRWWSPPRTTGATPPGSSTRTGTR